VALKDLLYRCPECGYDPLRGKGDEAWCRGCARRYHRAASGARIRIVEGGGGGHGTEVLRPLSALTRAIEERGGPLPAARSSDGSIYYGAEVRVRRSVEEEALRYRQELFGFFERLEEGRPGFLELQGGALLLREGEGGELRRMWELMDLRAVQSSSSSLQIFTVAEDLFHFRFADDSPVRWEALLHAVLRERYECEGRGSILEFQPRITVR